ncbi:hypothetical protein BE221DRAFT_64325 [Ostreococcus tauri]|uniref:Uncharacterized protein n=1 Tax=Ostreococcus tauri TaxID=70448 RepID=A0A1Y5HYC9_OSTTA|nr:hypothetical protein BE221DRAFT_64325 [Ostreococcus tauri]
MYVPVTYDAQGQPVIMMPQGYGGANRAPPPPPPPPPPRSDSFVSRSPDDAGTKRSTAAASYPTKPKALLSTARPNPCVTLSASLVEHRACAGARERDRQHPVPSVHPTLSQRSFHDPNIVRPPRAVTHVLVRQKTFLVSPLELQRLVPPPRTTPTPRHRSRRTARSPR